MSYSGIVYEKIMDYKPMKIEEEKRLEVDLKLGTDILWVNKMPPRPQPSHGVSGKVTAPRRRFMIFSSSTRVRPYGPGVKARYLPKLLPLFTSPEVILMNFLKSGRSTLTI
jgi:hypothetical protein